jgi:hypothetical protein
MITLPTCPELDEEAAPAVAGTFHYESLVLGLSGTIVFEQDGQQVRVIDTTYDQDEARALVGEAPLTGNHLNVVLTPKNGDTDYSARVRLAFDAAGDEFCLLSFTDTNDDVGGEGYYTGSR